MKTLRQFGKIAVRVIGWALLPLFLLLLLGLFFEAPTEFVLETIDLARMNSSTDAVITAVETERGSRGTSRPQIEYRFEVDGRVVNSDRLFPGWVANHSAWTGGGAAAKSYAVGNRVTVIYAANDPDQCALIRGWSKWSIGFMAWIWGMVISGIARKRRLLRAFGVATMAYGIALLFLGPNAVRLAELHFHVGVWLILLVMVYVLAEPIRWFDGPRTTR